MCFAFSLEIHLSILTLRTRNRKQLKISLANTHATQARALVNDHAPFSFNCSVWEPLVEVIKFALNCTPGAGQGAFKCSLSVVARAATHSRGIRNKSTRAVGAQKLIPDTRLAHDWFDSNRSELVSVWVWVLWYAVISSRNNGRCVYVTVRSRSCVIVSVAEVSEWDFYEVFN